MKSSAKAGYDGEQHRVENGRNRELDIQRNRIARISGQQKENNKAMRRIKLTVAYDGTAYKLAAPAQWRYHRGDVK